MKLMTQEIERNLPPLYHFETTKTPPVAIVKFFDPNRLLPFFCDIAEPEPSDQR